MNAPERFHPLVAHSLLYSLKRLDLDLYMRVCERFKLDEGKLRGLLGTVDSLGAGQLGELLADLRAQPEYARIVFLAGRNAMLGMAEALALRLEHRGGPHKFGAALPRLLPPLLGRSSFKVETRGRIFFVSLGDSLFARGADAEQPVCGFYAGALQELGEGCGLRHCEVVESACRGAAPELSTCTFQVPW